MSVSRACCHPSISRPRSRKYWRPRRSSTFTHIYFLPHSAISVFGDSTNCLHIIILKLSFSARPKCLRSTTGSFRRQSRLMPSGRRCSSKTLRYRKLRGELLLFSRRSIYQLTPRTWTNRGRSFERKVSGLTFGIRLTWRG